MIARRASARPSPRAALTRIELLTVTVIVVISACLILPGIVQTTGASRRSECMNNLRLIGIGIQNRALTISSLPGYGTYRCRFDENGLCTPLVPARSWQVDLSPYIGRQDIYDHWHENESFADSVSGETTNAILGQFSVKVFTCVNDPTAFGVPGGNSYVVNAGYSDLRFNQRHNEESINWNNDDLVNGPGSAIDRDEQDSQLTRDSGVAWMTIEVVDDGGRIRECLRGSHAIADIWDGESQTILATENINSGAPSTAPLSERTWANPDYHTSAFVFPVEMDGNRHADFSRTRLHADYRKKAKINGQMGRAEGNSPFPSSYHPQGCNFLFVDGHVHFLSAEIEEDVYVRLLSPGGTRERTSERGNLTPQEALGDNEF